MSSSFPTTSMETKSIKKFRCPSNNSAGTEAKASGSLNAHILEGQIDSPHLPGYYNYHPFQSEQFSRELNAVVVPSFSCLRLVNMAELPTTAGLAAIPYSPPFSVFAMPSSSFGVHLPVVVGAPHYMPAVMDPRLMHIQDCGVDHCVVTTTTPVAFYEPGHENIVRLSSMQPYHHAFGTSVNILHVPVGNTVAYAASPGTAFRDGRCLRWSMPTTPEPVVSQQEHLESNEDDDDDELTVEAAAATGHHALTQPSSLDRHHSITGSPSPPPETCNGEIGKPASSKTSTRPSRSKEKPAGFGALAKRLKEKLEGKPKRPLTAYNIFFKDERAIILKEIAEKRKQRENDEEGCDENMSGVADRQEIPKSITVTHDGRSNNIAACDGVEGLLALSAGETTSDEIKRKRRRQLHGKMGFEKMAKTISERWKTVDATRRADCERRSREDTLRYRAELAVYAEKRREALRATQQELESSVSTETKIRYLESCLSTTAKPG